MELFKYRLPNKKKWLLTDAFLTTFKEELNRIFKIDEKEEKPTYWNRYVYLDSTGGFYEALKIASEKHNVTKAIYEYACRLPGYHGDFFDSELTILMYKRGIIEEGNVDETNDDVKEEDLRAWEKNGEIEWTEETIHHKGYFVTKRDWHFVEKKENE